MRSQTETPKRVRYTGKERDEEYGFTYHGALPAWVARWNTADPAGLNDGTNPFAYVHGNPVQRKDENGRQSSLIIPNMSTGDVQVPADATRKAPIVVNLRSSPDGGVAMWKMGQETEQAIAENDRNQADYKRAAAAHPTRPVTSTHVSWKTVDPSTQVPWVLATTTHSPFPMATGVDTGNIATNVVLNRWLLPWVNVFASVANTPFEISGAIDDAMKGSRLSMEWQAFQDLAPLGELMGSGNIVRAIDEEARAFRWAQLYEDERGALRIGKNIHTVEVSKEQKELLLAATDAPAIWVAGDETLVQAHRNMSRAPAVWFAAPHQQASGVLGYRNSLEVGERPIAASKFIISISRGGFIHSC